MVTRLGGAAQVKRCKSITEAVRERETLKYFPTLRSTITVDDTQHHLLQPDSKLKSANDAILTALAQAGVSQTGTQRAMISLFDADNQYIIAEATATSPLRPSVTSTASESLWLCGTVVPRRNGVCELSLPATSADDGEPLVPDGEDLPLTISDDLTCDPRFCSRAPYGQPASLARFYAAVPIRSRRGIHIGVYCVLSEIPGKHWNAEFTQRLRDISHSVMGHLESKRLEALYKRNIRMNRGLGSFLEGESTVARLQARIDPLDLIDEFAFEGNLNEKQQGLQHGDGGRPATSTVSTARQAEPAQAALHRQSRDASECTPHSQRSDAASGAASSISDDNSPILAFSRASNLIRESMEVEGCVFVDAAIEGYRTLSQTGAGPIKEPMTSSSDDSPGHTSGDQPVRPCSILGFSTSVNSSIDGDAPGFLSTALPEKFLAKLLRRYPNGKIFNFDRDGALHSSESSDSDSGITRPPEAGNGSSIKDDDAAASSTSPQPRLLNRPWARHREGSILARAFSGARCVAFAPVWDPRKGRWHAGSFVYTNAPARHFTDQDELNFLRAFSILTMSEILRAADAQADKAKADVLGSLSHELRSPLHGVILSAELLRESDLSVFQETAAHTIELCSRTLLDTIDHLLDYSKINSFARKGRQADGRAARSRRPLRAVAALDDPLQHGKKSLACVCQLDNLVEEVVESVFAGYTFQFMSAKRPPQNPPMAPDASRGGRQGSVSTQNLTHLDPLLMEKSRLGQEFALVSVILSIDPRQDWSCFVQVGAIRRIVMNIFGNALKYTKTGSIRVTLSHDVAVLNLREKQRVVKLTVEDTGKGISADFIQHGLFKPFSQEDPLSPGTGLGLSLVKRIVSEMRGELSIQSQVGIGTTVVVTLPLEQVSADSGRGTIRADMNWKFLEQVTSLKGLRVGLALSQQPSGLNAVDWSESVRAVCKDWLMMDIVSSSCGDTLPDIILWSHDALPSSSQELKALARTPNVVLCSNALVAHDHSASFDAANHVGVFEFVSQPIGPRKLAGALLLAYTRWMQLISSPTSKFTSQSGFRNADELTMAKYDASTLGPSRPSIHREPSSFQSAGSPTEDEAIFSDSNAQPAAVATMSGESPSSELPNPFDKFLLVDDNHINIKVLAAYMKKLNIEYDTAVNGREAVELFCKAEKQYNCVLMDISMPIMNGFEATRHMRAYEKLEKQKRVPIIALSGLASEDAQKEAIGSGMDVLLTKPVQLKTLGNLLRSEGIIADD